jgi:hypothetical protein
MRLTGSFQTMVTHGRSGEVTSSVEVTFSVVGASEAVTQGITRAVTHPP